MFITKENLIEKGACSSGMQWFEQNFPEGGEYQEVLNKLAEQNEIGFAQWGLSQFGRTDTVLEVEEIDCSASIFFAGSVVVKGLIKVANFLLAGRGIKAGWGIEAGRGIKAGSGIEAGSGIKAGSGIEAGSGIKAGWGIEAGSGIEAGDDFGIYAGLRVRISLKKEYAVIHAKEEPRNIVCGEYKGAKDVG